MHRAMRRPCSASYPKAPAGHGSICTLSTSVMPRRARAAMYSGCSLVREDRVRRLAEEQRGSHAGDDVPAVDRAVGERDHDLGDVDLGTGQELHLDLAIRIRREVRLRRFLENDVDEGGAVGPAIIGSDEGTRLRDFLARQHVQGVGHPRMLPARRPAAVKRGSRRGSGVGRVEVGGALAAAVDEQVRARHVGGRAVTRGTDTRRRCRPACPCGRAERSRRPRRCRPRRRSAGATARCG